MVNLSLLLIFVAVMCFLLAIGAAIEWVLLRYHERRRRELGETEADGMTTGDARGNKRSRV